jgi:hypothetical protein
MKRGLRRVVATALCVGLSAAVAFAGETAKPRSTAGTSTVTRDGKTTDVGTSTQFQEKDVVRVPADGRLTIEFADASSVSLVGPATVNLAEMSEKGRRLVLHSGVIAEAVVRGVAMEIQAPSPNDASLVLQNARGAARVNPGDKIVFHKLEGKYAKVWRANKDSDLGETPWLLNVRSGSASEAAPSRPAAGAEAAAAGAASGKKAPFVEKSMSHDRAVITNGVKSIVFHPASAFTRERTQDGGFKLTMQGDDGEWGVVEIGLETTMFVGQGQTVEFDSDGRVTRFSGVSHGYRPLMGAIYHADPIQDASDASPSFSRHR